MSDAVHSASQAMSSMEGKGFYNRNSAMQAASIALLLPLWKEACGTAELGNDPLVIADYGSSQGSNSMAPMRIAIEVLRDRAGSEVPVQVFHTDLPADDFSSLFEALQDPARSYSAGLANVFSAAIGRSYFEQLLPPGLVNLGWNTWTIHWLSDSPGDAPDHVVAGLSGEPSVSAAVKNRQAADWRRFLELRSIEMRRGAKLLSTFLARTDEGSGWEWLCGNSGRPSSTWVGTGCSPKRISSG